MNKQDDNPRKNQQRRAIRRQKAFGAALREWLHDREIKATKRLAKQRKKDARSVKGKRGVDRVPKRLRLKPRPTEYIVQHELRWDSERNRMHRGKPHVNPERNEQRLKPGTTNAARRRAARIRKELR